MCVEGCCQSGHNVREHTKDRLVVQHNGDERQHKNLGIGALQLAIVDPGLQISSQHFDQFAEMLTQEGIEIFSQFQRTKLQ